MDEARIYTLPVTKDYPPITVMELQDTEMRGSFCAVRKALVLPIGTYAAIKRTHEAIADVPRFSCGVPRYAPRTLYRADGKETIIIEEWIDGQTLYDLEKSRKADVLFLSEIGIRLLAILRDLTHRHNVYHADLTPANILLSRNKELKIVDFDPWYPVDVNRNAQADNVSGSMPFIPPEHLFGELCFNAEKAAVYCAGAIMHYMQYGHPPFCAEFTRAHTERLMFGPKGIRKDRAAKIQREDYRLFKEKVISCINDPNAENHTDSFSALLNPNPKTRVGFAAAIEVFRELRHLRS